MTRLMKSLRLRRHSSLVIRTTLITAVIVMVVRVIDWQRLLGQVHGGGFIIGILAAQPFILASMALQSWRHGLLIAKPPPPFLAVFAAFVLATGLNVILPARVGELIKASYMHARCGVPLGVGLGAVAVERLLDVLTLAVMGCVGALMLAVDRRWAWGLGLAIPVIVLGAALLFSRLGRIEGVAAAWLERRRWPVIAGIALPMLRHIGDHMSSRLLARVAALTALGWINCGIAYMVFIDRAGDGWPGFPTSLLLLVTTSVGGAIPILPGGIATFEGAAVLTLTTNGYDINAALILAVGLHLCLWATVLPIAMSVLAFQGTGLRSILAMTRELAANGPGRSPKEKPVPGL